jgi:hypothetical protein
VGILILLVMVVGARATQSILSAPKVTAEAGPPAVAAEELLAAQREAVEIERETGQLLARAIQLRSETSLREQERVWLATFVAAAKEELNARRAELDEERRREFDLSTKTADVQQELDSLMREQIALLSQAPEVEQIESLPTPLAKSVKGRELHLRLAAGHVAVVPFDKLRDEFEAYVERNVWRLREHGEMSGTVGPIDGFRLRYRIQLQQVAVAHQAGFDTLHTVPKWRCEFLPISPRLGEPVEQAVMPASGLHRILKMHAPEATTVTIWTYPDSFHQFRTLKKALFELGYAAAGRPLPDGVPIGASPDGTESAAQ